MCLVYCVPIQCIVYIVSVNVCISYIHSYLSMALLSSPTSQRYIWMPLSEHTLGNHVNPMLSIAFRGQRQHPPPLLLLLFAKSFCAPIQIAPPFYTNPRHTYGFTLWCPHAGRHAQHPGHLVLMAFCTSGIWASGMKWRIPWSGIGTSGVVCGRG